MPLCFSYRSESHLRIKSGKIRAYSAFVKASAEVPTILTVALDRPAILTNVNETAAASIGNFGIDDAAPLDLICGRAKPQGRLPFELPSSVEDGELAKERRST
jgi:beta-glucosidase